MRGGELTAQSAILAYGARHPSKVATRAPECCDAENQINTVRLQLAGALEKFTGLREPSQRLCRSRRNDERIRRTRRECDETLDIAPRARRVTDEREEFHPKLEPFNVRGVAADRPIDPRSRGLRTTLRECHGGNGVERLCLFRREGQRVTSQPSHRVVPRGVRARLSHTGECQCRSPECVGVARVDAIRTLEFAQRLLVHRQRPRSVLPVQAIGARERRERRRVARSMRRQHRALTLSEKDIEFIRRLRRECGLYREGVCQRHDLGPARPPRVAIGNSEHHRAEVKLRRAGRIAHPMHRRMKHIVGAEGCSHRTRATTRVLHRAHALTIDDAKSGKLRQFRRHGAAQTFGQERVCRRPSALERKHSDERRFPALAPLHLPHAHSAQDEQPERRENRRANPTRRILPLER